MPFKKIDEPDLTTINPAVAAIFGAIFTLAAVVIVSLCLYSTVPSADLIPVVVLAGAGIGLVPACLIPWGRSWIAALRRK